MSKRRKPSSTSSSRGKYIIEPDLMVYWLPLLHPCGDVIVWGTEHGPKHIAEFFPIGVQHPCPWHGSATGVPSNVPKDQNGYVESLLMFYGMGTEDQREEAAKNAEIARGTGFQDLMVTMDKATMQQRWSETMLTLSGNMGCQICGDEPATAGTITNDLGEHDGQLCDDCILIRKSMFNEDFTPKEAR